MQKFRGCNKGFASLSFVLLSSALLAVVSLSIANGYTIYRNANEKIISKKLAQQVLLNESDKIRSLSYDLVKPVSKSSSEDLIGYNLEVLLGKEYREDLGNSVLKRKPVTVNVYDSISESPIVSSSFEKVSRWYKSGSFDTSNNGIYDESGVVQKGTITKTGPGTGYVFLKPGSKIYGDIEVYSETNGDIYIYCDLGVDGKKTIIRQVGPSTSSGYIRFDKSCKLLGNVEIENSSNGGFIIKNTLKDGIRISKTGKGIGHLTLDPDSVVGNNVEFYNDSSGVVVLQKNIHDNVRVKRVGSSDGMLVLRGDISKNLNINMENSGKVILINTFNKEMNINYSSSSNKTLILGGTFLAENVSFINNSQGFMNFYGKMSNNSTLTYKGNGVGSLSLYSAINGNPIFINETDGYIWASDKTTFTTANVIEKKGTGKGTLNFQYATVKGRFTLDSNSNSRFDIDGGLDGGLQGYRCPMFADGAYINVIGEGFNAVRLAWGLDILGKATLNFNGKNYLYFYAGSYNNGNEGFKNTVFQDGYNWISS